MRSLFWWFRVFTTQVCSCIPHTGFLSFPYVLTGGHWIIETIKWIVENKQKLHVQSTNILQTRQFVI